MSHQTTTQAAKPNVSVSRNLRGGRGKKWLVVGPGPLQRAQTDCSRALEMRWETHDRPLKMNSERRPILCARRASLNSARMLFGQSVVSDRGAPLLQHQETAQQVATPDDPVRDEDELQAPPEYLDRRSVFHHIHSVNAGGHLWTRDSQRSETEARDDRLPQPSPPGQNADLIAARSSQHLNLPAAREGHSHGR